MSKGGSGGRGGHGGPSRTDNEGRIVVHSGMSGSSGRSGTSGHSGVSGAPGHPGSPGASAAPAAHGAVSFAVLNSNGAIVESAPTCFDLCISGYLVNDDRADQIFEPGEAITISHVRVVNVGGITCPAGALLQFFSSPTVEFSPGASSAVLPEIAGHGGSFVVPGPFAAKLFDVPPAMLPGPFSGSARFSCEISMLGRPFFDSRVATELPMTYSARFGQTIVAKQLGINEKTDLVFEIRNVSALPIEANETLLRLELDERIVAMTVSLTFPLERIEPGGLAQVKVSASLRADALLFENYAWKALLILRGKEIEFCQGNIRMSPLYSPNLREQRSADVLVFTSNLVTRQEFVAWQQMFSMLSLTVDYWDIEKVA